SSLRIVLGAIRNPLMLDFESKPINIEPQRRFHVGDTKKRHYLFNIRSHGCHAHNSPHSQNRKWYQPACLSGSWISINADEPFHSPSEHSPSKHSLSKRVNV